MELVAWWTRTHECGCGRGSRWDARRSARVPTRRCYWHTRVVPRYVEFFLTVLSIAHVVQAR